MDINNFEIGERMLAGAKHHINSINENHGINVSMQATAFTAVKLLAGVLATAAQGDDRALLKTQLEAALASEILRIDSFHTIRKAQRK